MKHAGAKLLAPHARYMRWEKALMDRGRWRALRSEGGILLLHRWRTTTRLTRLIIIQEYRGKHGMPPTIGWQNLTESNPPP
jgi:hypothetical protein